MPPAPGNRRAPPFRRPGGWSGLILGLLGVLLAGSITLGADLPPAGAPRDAYRILPLSRVAQVLDGDTFDADLDGDGRIQTPRERIRLLFVDTPELSESHKGRDRAHGLPAQRFLEQQFKERALRLLVPLTGSEDRFGRTLAVVEARQGSGEWINVNLALIRAGHSPFDTRFALPGDYDRWEAAEGDAFEARGNIWADAPSRQRYLKRLRQELKTPTAPGNPLYLPGVLEAETFTPQAVEGRYVRLRGEVRSRRTLAKGVELLTLKRGKGRSEFAAVVFPHRARVLDVHRWNPGMRVEVHGFILRYKNRLELQVHYGRRAATPPK